MHLSVTKQDYFDQFPNAESDKGGDAIKYKVEDSEYRIYYPNFKGSNTLELQLDHIRGGATDDHVELEITFNNDASISSISGTWKAGNDGYKIPKVVIEAVDATAEVLGAAGALETLGISEAVANGIVAGFDAFCELFNKISPIIVKLSDDGGRFYFTAVVCHAVNRLNSTMRVEN